VSGADTLGLLLSEGADPSSARIAGTGIGGSRTRDHRERIAELEGELVSRRLWAMELTRQIREVRGIDEFKKRLEKKYGHKVVDSYQKQGIPVFILSNGDEVEAWDEKKLIGNPFGRRKKGGGIPAHFAQTKYSETGYKSKGDTKFRTNYAMKFGAGTIGYAKGIGLTDTQIRQAERAGVGNADDIRAELDKLVSKPASAKPVPLDWNNLHIQSREEILSGAGMQTKLASKKWAELDPWIQETLKSSLGKRSSGKAKLEKLSKTGAKERPSLDNTVGLYPSNKSWRNFLKDAELREEKKGIKHYISGNGHYVVLPDGEVLTFYGYHGQNVFDKLVADKAGWLKGRAEAEKEVDELLHPKSDKQPWRMTQEEYNLFATNAEKRRVGSPEVKSISVEIRPGVLSEWGRMLVDSRKMDVEKALKDGKPVPASVLADYPELKKRAEAGERVIGKQRSRSESIKPEHKRLVSLVSSYKPISMGDNPKFTGTKGEMDVMDDPAQFRKRYIDNLEAHLENIRWRLDNNVYGDAPVPSLLAEAERITDDLKVAKRMTPMLWGSYIAVFRKSPMDKIPLVSEVDADRAETGKAMGLTAKQIQQARDEGVTTIVGLRRIEKNTRRASKATDLQAIHDARSQYSKPVVKHDRGTGEWEVYNPDIKHYGDVLASFRTEREADAFSELWLLEQGRTERSKSADESQSNALTVDPDDPRVERWIKDQGRMDVVEVDTPRRKPRKAKAMAIRKKTYRGKIPTRVRRLRG